MELQIGTWEQHTVDRSRDVEYPAKTDTDLLKQHNFDMGHVLTGEVNAAGKSTGNHAEFAADGAARIAPKAVRRTGSTPTPTPN